MSASDARKNELERAASRNCFTTTEAKTMSSAFVPRDGSKQALVVGMLSGTRGATLKALVEATAERLILEIDG